VLLRRLLHHPQQHTAPRFMTKSRLTRIGVATAPPRKFHLAYDLYVKRSSARRPPPLLLPPGEL
jgi:hypothetical protein